MRRLTLLSLLAAALCCLAPGARADRFRHALPRQIKAAVLLIPSTTPGPPRPGGNVNSPWYPLGQNLNPYVFYIADGRRDLKPEGWEFVNPLAPATVSDTMVQRWARIQGTIPLPPG